MKEVFARKFTEFIIIPILGKADAAYLHQYQYAISYHDEKEESVPYVNELWNQQGT
jgi:hypothetical protein